jgi:hypothetical protein
MDITLKILLATVCCPATMFAQTAEEVINKNLEARGGIDKIKAMHSYRMSGKVRQGSFTAEVGEEAKEPGLLRQTVTIQGMTAIAAYDGSIGWQISPFGGRKDPERVGDDDLRDLVEDADFHGPLVDYKTKGHTVEYLGHDTVDGDDALRLKVTLKNGDVVYDYLDPDTYMEIRIERQQFIRGAVRETLSELGSYKQVAGVYYPFSIEKGPKADPTARAKITVDKIEVNIPVDEAAFKMPGAAPASSTKTNPQPPAAPEPKKPPQSSGPKQP